MRDLSAWTPRPRPDGRPLAGRTVRLERLTAAHGRDLGPLVSGEAVAALYTYLFDPLPSGPAEVEAWAGSVAEKADPFFYAAVDPTTGRAIGRAALMRIDPAHGAIEVGSILWSPALARSTAATEAIALFAGHVFDELGYRRFEWKCDALNLPSRRAAERLGFAFEGIFRRHMVVKGKNRDTAWYAMTEDEWPQLQRAFAAWLAPSNFDATGRQRTSLADWTARSIAAGDDRLRRGFLNDVAALVAFQRAAYARTRETIGAEPLPLMWDYDEIARNAEIWLAEAADGIAGATILRPGNGVLTLESIATAPKVAGSGLGQAMMVAATERARRLGLSRLRLVTAATNPAADWYRRTGFRVTREEAARDRTLLHMEREVAASP